MKDGRVREQRDIVYSEREREFDCFANNERKGREGRGEKVITKRNS